jgi:hypothetical protein
MGSSCSTIDFDAVIIMPRKRGSLPTKGSFPTYADLPAGSFPGLAFSEGEFEQQKPTKLQLQHKRKSKPAYSFRSKVKLLRCSLMKKIHSDQGTIDTQKSYGSTIFGIPSIEEDGIPLMKFMDEYSYDDECAYYKKDHVFGERNQCAYLSLMILSSSCLSR